MSMSGKRRIERMLYDILVEDNREVFTIRKPFKGLIQPYGPESPYPFDHIGNFGRITPRYIENWVNVGSLLRKINSPRFQRPLDDFQVEEQRQIVLETLHKIGTDSYLTEGEWKSQESCHQIDSIIESGTKVTVLANQLLAESLVGKVNSYFSQRDLSPKDHFVVCDIGCGTGNTIMPLIEAIDEITRSSRRSLELVLVDGQEEALNITAKRINARLSGYRNLRTSITKVKENFGDLSRNPVLTDYLGQVDIIVSGAAIMHNTDKQPFFGMMYDLLKWGGMFGCWDWYFKSFLAPSLRRGEEICRIVTLMDRSGLRDSYQLSEDEPLSEEIMERQASSQMSVVGVLPNKELELSLQNNLNWLWLFGYLRTNQDTGETEEKQIYDSIQGRFEPVSERLTKMFWEGVEFSGGFNFIEDFLSLLEGAPHFKETTYKYIESYGDDYAPQLKWAGFRYVQEFCFGAMLECFPQKAPVESEAQTEAIRFTYGSKEG